VTGGLTAPRAGIGPVTVCVTNYNGAPFLEACLAALAELRGEVAAVVVVDNASTDDSVARFRAVAAAEPWASRARERDSGGALELIELPSNEGPCPARNAGLARARTAWVLQLDSDVLVRPDTLELLAAQAELPGVVAVQPRAVLASDPSVIHYDGGRIHYTGMLCLDRLMGSVHGAPSEPEDVDAVISMALLLRREAVLEAGAYDPAFFILFEDADLSYRLRARGLRLRRVPAAVVLHREGTAGISFRPGAPAYPARRAFLHARNRGYLVLKNYSWSTLVLTLPGRCLYALVYLGFSASRGMLGSYLRGRLALLGLVPRALAQRRLLAGRRVLGDAVLLGAEDLTLSTVIVRSRLEARIEKAFNVVLRAWWRTVRWMLPEAS
jgi:GT2 family glycosyltransferase